jgi:cell division protein FtsW (lipid II flippase)
LDGVGNQENGAKSWINLIYKETPQFGANITSILLVIGRRYLVHEEVFDKWLREGK